MIGAEAGMHLVALLPPGVSDVAISRRVAEIGTPVRCGLILGYGGTDAWGIYDGICRLTMSI